MNIMLIIAAVILIGGAILGAYLGFAKMVLSLVSTIVVIVVTLIFSPLTTKYFMNNENIYNAIYKKVEYVIDIDAIQGKITDERSFIPNTELPDELINGVDDGSIDASDVNAYLCASVTSMIIKAMGFVVTLLVVSAAVALICFLLNLVSKLPVFSQINRIAGMATGVMEAVLVLWIVFIIVTMLSSTEAGQSALMMIYEDKFLTFLYDNNALAKIIM